jgi:hypothetical protein
VSHALSPTFVISSTKAAALFAAGQPVMESVAANVLALTQEVLKSMSLSKVKACTAGVLCAALLALAGGSFVSPGIAQDATPKNVRETVVKTESDGDFIRRMSKDLRGTEPTPAEIHFFVANKDAGKRQKLIDLFIEERNAKRDAAVAREIETLARARLRWIRTHVEVINIQPPRLVTLQKDFYKELRSAKDKADIARVTQSYLDRIINFLKANPTSQDAPDAIRQIVLVYESQGKTVEADAWRAKLPKEGPKVHSDKDKGK